MKGLGNMTLFAVNNDNKNISIDEFFSKFAEFSANNCLVKQTSRILNVLLRHPNDVEQLSFTERDGYAFQVSGMFRTYTIVFHITNQSIVLTEIW